MDNMGGNPDPESRRSRKQVFNTHFDEDNILNVEITTEFLVTHLAV